MNFNSSPNNNFEASWGGSPVYNSPDAPDFGYTLYSGTFTGSGYDSVSFFSYNVYGFYYLDDVSVVGPAPVPEPATMLLLGSGLIGLAGYGRKKCFKK